MRAPYQHHPRDRFRDESGAGLVEFALILPLLMALVLGLISGGVAYNRKQQLTHAAREGARYGASLAHNQTLTGTATWASAVRDVIRTRAEGDLDDAASTVCVSLVEGSAGAGPGVIVVSNTSNPPAAHGAANYTTRSDLKPCRPGETFPTTANDAGRRVQVVVTRPSELEVIFFSHQLTLRSAATSRYEG